MNKYSKFYLILILLFVSVSCEVIIGDHAWIRDTSLIFSPTELEDATVGLSYEATISISNNDTPVDSMYLVWDESEYLDGLSLNHESLDNNAVLSGIPEKVGVFEFTIKAYCLGTNKTGQHGEQHYRLVVKK